MVFLTFTTQTTDFFLFLFFTSLKSIWSRWSFHMPGYFLYFVLILLAACKGWLCWSSSCGFTVMGMLLLLQIIALLPDLCWIGKKLHGKNLVLQLFPIFYSLQHFFCFYLSGMCFSIIICESIYKPGKRNKFLKEIV